MNLRNVTDRELVTDLQIPKIFSIDAGSAGLNSRAV
jgi:hypothetical protein